MDRPVRIALDAMGGDFGPSVVAPAAAAFLNRQPNAVFLMFGDQKQIEPYLTANPILAAATTIRHTDFAIGMADKPSKALRAGRRTSSMWMAIEAVKKGEADCAVSAGNTGVLMAMSKVCLGTMAQVDRPALAAIWPTLRGRSIVLDVGATIGANAQRFVDLAIMGSAMARSLFSLERPTVGLLNVGVEVIEGAEEIKAASHLLQDLDSPTLKYRGFVKGDDIGKGTVDVVVTEGFTGNIALKTAEGTQKQIAALLREGRGHSLIAKLGFIIARNAFLEFKARMTPRESSGALLLGLDGVVFKSHGGASADVFSGAIGIAHDIARHGLLEEIRDRMSESWEEHAVALEGGGQASVATVISADGVTDSKFTPI
ncbi:MAG TPA: phosphate acyltransferase PlsX [Methylosinus sp.]|uniref:phosphate acyltransferase PlsX n=1 Tax=Methylosinus sp. TaxID=427 RepID=UPI002F9453FC